MKLFLSIILIIALCTALFGCTKAEQGPQPEVSAFRVGYGQVEITPEDSVPLQGYGNTSNRMSTGFLNRIYTTCVAITDESDNTVLFYGNDLTTSVRTITDMVRVSVSQATGVPQENIMLSASHTHSAPDTGNTNEPSQVKYNRQLVQWMTQAAVMAMENREAAEMYIGSVEIEGQSFVRHYLLDDGTSVGYESLINNNAVEHVGQGDYTMQLIKFVRQEQEDVLMVNWQVHPHRTGGSNKYNIASDIVGVLRSELETQLGCKVAYYQAAAGNMNPTSYVPGEEVADNYQDQGRQIAQFVIDAGEDIYTKAETGAVQVLRASVDAPVDHTEDHLVVFAKEVQSVWTSTNNRTQADAVGKPHGIRSPYHANAIVRNSQQGATRTMELNAVSIGSVAFVTAGYEMFAANGMYIKENSPYDMTFVVGYSNEHNNYIPASYVFEYDAYEVDNNYFEKGTAEMLAEKFVSMLETLDS